MSATADDRAVTGGTAMTVEFIGIIHHREASETIAPPPVVMDRGYIRDFAQAAETGGFDKVLVGYYSDGPDGFLLAARLRSDRCRSASGQLGP
jgi:hypothetical protein